MKDFGDQKPALLTLPSKQGGSRWWANLVAVGITSATLGFRLYLGDVLGDYPSLIVFAIPIGLSAYLGGLVPGLLATLLSFLGASYYLLPPLHSLAIADASSRWQQLTVTIAGTLISVICEL